MGSAISMTGRKDIGGNVRGEMRRCFGSDHWRELKVFRLEKRTDITSAPLLRSVPATLYLRDSPTLRLCSCSSLDTAHATGILAQDDARHLSSQHTDNAERHPSKSLP